MPQEDRLMTARSPFIDIDIPEELILVIADHLPLESLLRLRATNKWLWNLLTPRIKEYVKKFFPQQIVAGFGHTLALTEAGTLYAWGSNDKGRLGIGNTEDQSAPVRVERFDGDAIKQIVAGYDHTLALTEAGTLYAWGSNDKGRLGIGNTEDQSAPVRVEGFDGEPIKQIVAGALHTLALTEAGALYAWGWNYSGRLGIGNTEEQSAPVRVEGFDGEPIKQIVAGAYYTLALTEVGALYAWGSNLFGQLGIGSRAHQSAPVRVERFDDEPIKQIVAGAYYTLALTEAGALYAWGWNDDGQLGIGNTEDQSAPVRVEGFDGEPIKQIVAGDNYTLALTEAGALYAWGWNLFGRLGIGNTEDQSAPVRVEGFDGEPIKQIVVGASHTLVLTEAGALYAWGWNRFGRLGIGNTEDQSAPVRVEGFDGEPIKQIVAGYDHTLALTEAGALYVWGKNDTGQLGIGNTEDQSAPVKIERFDGIANPGRFFYLKADSPARSTDSSAAAPAEKAMECALL